MLLINQIVFFLPVWRRKSHMKQSWTFEIKINLRSVFFSLSPYDVWILRLMMHLTHLFSLFTYWKNVTLCLSSLLIMMNWSSSHSLTSHSLSPSVLFFLLTRCDVRQCAYTFLIQFLSPNKFNCFIHIWCACLSTSLSTFKNLSLSWTYRKRTKERKKTRISFFFLFRWIFHPLQSKNENHHHQHVIITYSYITTRTRSLHSFIHI